MEAAHDDGSKTNNCPTNLRWATRKENNDDRIKHGTTTRGERNAAAKLTAAQVVAIRHMPGKHAEIAAAFGVTCATISMIKLRRTWMEL